jgi:1-acyl-sn-glycerol-3-phosphate acyltransferase
VTILRSALFNILFVLWTATLCFVWLPALLGPRIWTPRGQSIWARGVMAMLKSIARIDIEIRGRERLPAGAVVIASKHQSAWDTMIWHIIVDDPAIVMKKELLLIPLYGWFSKKAGMIPVDRKAGAAALRAMLRAADAAAARGRPIIIFPEGTRSAPGQRLPYQPGAMAFYRHLKLPVAPVALNSGLFWSKHSLLKRPGKIILEFLDPIGQGLAKEDFNAELESRIESATARLVAEGEEAA